MIISWLNYVHPIDPSTSSFNAALKSEAPVFAALEFVFERVLGFAATAFGIGLFAMLIMGGFKFLTAGGDQKAMAAAKQTITWAIVGLFALLGSWFLLSLVFQLTGGSILEFSVPSP